MSKTCQKTYKKRYKKHRKAPPKLETSTNLEAKSAAELINLDDCIQCIARTSAFITLKDYKRDFIVKRDKIHYVDLLVQRKTNLAKLAN